MRVNKEIIKGVFWGVLVCILISMCTSCKHTEYITVPEVHTEYISKTDSFLVRDSIYLRDSIFSYVQGDTIFLNKYQTKYVEKIRWEVRTDTLVKRDSIPYPVAHEVVKTKTDYRGWYVASLLAIPIVLWLRRKLKVLFM